jgi:hypothetical protein
MGTQILRSASVTFVGIRSFFSAVSRVALLAAE